MVKRSNEAVSGAEDSSVSTRERNYKATLTLYIQSSDIDSINELLSSVDDAELKTCLTTHALHEAFPVYAMSNDIVLNALASNIDVSRPEGLYFLTRACEKGKLDVIATLIDRGININSQDESSFSPLHYAVIYDQYYAVIDLLYAGADIDAKTSDGFTALHFAAARNLSEVTTLLLDSGADIEARSNNGMTPLLSAAYDKASKVIPVLIAADADIKAEDNEGKTALVHAIFGNDGRELIEISDTIDVLGGAPLQNNAGTSILSYRDDYNENECEDDESFWEEIWGRFGENLPTIDQIDLSGDLSDAESI